MKEILLKAFAFLFSLFSVTTTISLRSTILILFYAPIIALGVLYPRKIDENMDQGTFKLVSFFSQGIITTLFIAVLASLMVILSLFFTSPDVNFILINSVIALLLPPLLVKEYRNFLVFKSMQETVKFSELQKLNEEA